MSEEVRCAIYTRLSKEDEDRQGDASESIRNQKALLTAYAADRGWTVFQVYCDEDYSGADRLRPAFNRMLRDAEEGRFRVVLCKSQSRFTRDMELVEKYIHGLFPLWGIRFVAVADNADTQVRGNKKARQINGLVNEWYLEDLSENIRTVLDMKRRQGQYIGGAPIYGYRKDPADRHRLVVDPEAAGVVRQIFRWSLEGRGKQEIARLLNAEGIPNPTRYKLERGWPGVPPGADGQGLWNKTTVWRILRNEMYTGVMVQGRRKKVSYKSKALVDLPREQWFRVEGTHEAIVDAALFQAVQQGLALRARGGGGGTPHPLAGLARCMDCGSAMSRTANARQGPSYLRCRRYADGGGCTRHAVRLDALTELVAEQVRRYVGLCCPPGTLALPAAAVPEEDARERERKALAARLARNRQALKALYLDKVEGLLSREQFCALNQSFLAEQAELEERLARLEAAPCPEGGGDMAGRMEELLRLEQLPRALAALLIEAVEIGERNPETGEQAVRITWKF